MSGSESGAGNGEEKSGLHVNLCDQVIESKGSLWSSNGYCRFVNAERRCCMCGEDGGWKIEDGMKEVVKKEDERWEIGGFCLRRVELCATKRAEMGRFLQ